jgi:hypothetical protein
LSSRANPRMTLSSSTAALLHMRHTTAPHASTFAHATSPSLARTQLTASLATRWGTCVCRVATPSPASPSP